MLYNQNILAKPDNIRKTKKLTLKSKLIHKFTNKIKIQNIKYQRNHKKELLKLQYKTIINPTKQIQKN